MNPDIFELYESIHHYYMIKTLNYCILFKNQDMLDGFEEAMEFVHNEFHKYFVDKG